MRGTLTGFASLALVLALAAPAAAQGKDTTAKKPKIKRNPDVITAAEIAERPELTNAYEVVQRLRPLWLRDRTPGYAIVVYVDEVRTGGVSQLTQIPANSVEEIRHMSASDATTRYGTGNADGAILVKTARRGGG